VNEFDALKTLAHGLTRLLERNDRLDELNAILHEDLESTRGRATQAEGERDDWKHKCAELEATRATHAGAEARLNGLITRLLDLVAAHEAISATLDIPPHTAAAIDLASLRRRYTHLNEQHRKD
jgi:hypothetical protein